MPVARGVAFGLGQLFHCRLPGAPRHFRVGGRQIRPGNLQVKHWLAVGLVLGMEDRKRLGFVLGAQAVLFARGGVFGVKNSGSPKQDEFRFHRLISLIEKPVRFQPRL